MSELESACMIGEKAEAGVVSLERNAVGLRDRLILCVYRAPALFSGHRMRAISDTIVASPPARDCDGAG